MLRSYCYMLRSYCKSCITWHNNCCHLDQSKIQLDDTRWSVRRKVLATIQPANMRRNKGPLLFTSAQLHQAVSHRRGCFCCAVVNDLKHHIPVLIGSNPVVSLANHAGYKGEKWGSSFCKSADKNATIVWVGELGWDSDFTQDSAPDSSDSSFSGACGSHG